MAIFLIAVTILIVVCIGLVTIGRVSASLADTPPPMLYDMEEAVAYVGEELPLETKSRVSYEEVAEVLTWHMEYLQERGVATTGSSLVVDEEIMVHDEDALPFVLQQVALAQKTIGDEDVLNILDASMQYLVAVGAIQTSLPEKS